MKTFISIFCVLTVIAVIFVSTRFTNRTSYAHDAFIAADHGHPVDLTTVDSYPVHVNQVRTSMPAPSFGPVAQPAIQRQSHSLSPVPNGFSATKTRAPNQERFANSAPPQPTFPSNSQGFNNPSRKLRTGFNSGTSSIRQTPTKSVNGSGNNAGFGGNFSKPSGQPAFPKNGVSPIANHALGAWPSNAKNVKSLVRTEYSLPAEAADSIVKFFAADGGDNIETKIASVEKDVLVSLQITTDEKTQRAIATFLDAVYPQTRLDTIQASAAPTKPVKSFLPTNEIPSNEPVKSFLPTDEMPSGEPASNQPAVEPNTDSEPLEKSNATDEFPPFEATDSQ